MKKEKYTILITDDDFNSFCLLKEYLSNYNIKTLYASSGSEAIELCIKNDISLILMDIIMKGMNGFETALHINSFKKDIPVIFQTAFAKEYTKDELMNNIGNGYLEKPIRKEALLIEIGKHLDLSLSLSTKPKNKFRFMLSTTISHLFAGIF